MNINEVKRRLLVQIWMDFGIWLVFRYVAKHFLCINSVGLFENGVSKNKIMGIMGAHFRYL